MSRESILAAKPVASILIAAYNAGKFIDASVASALAQSLPDLEVIVVDDGSTDDTVVRLRACPDPRLRVIVQGHQGAAHAYNAAVRAARADYIGFLDSDDIWLPQKLARHVAFLEENPGADATFSWVRMINESGDPLRIPGARWRGPISAAQLLGDFVIRTASAVVMRRRAADEAGFFESHFDCPDLEFFLRVALLRPENTHAIPEVLTLYRRHLGQLSADLRRMQRDWERALCYMRQRAPEMTAAVERIAAGNMYRYYSWLAYESGDFREAFRMIRRSVALRPGSLLHDSRSWKMAAAAVVGLTLPNRVLFALEKLAGFERPGGNPGGNNVRR